MPLELGEFRGSTRVPYGHYADTLHAVALECMPGIAVTGSFDVSTLSSLRCRHRWLLRHAAAAVTVINGCCWLRAQSRRSHRRLAVSALDIQALRWPCFAHSDSLQNSLLACRTADVAVTGRFAGGVLQNRIVSRTASPAQAPRGYLWAQDEAQGSA